jgi:hypothetical protein
VLREAATRPIADLDYLVPSGAGGGDLARIAVHEVTCHTANRAYPEHEILAVFVVRRSSTPKVAAPSHLGDP